MNHPCLRSFLTALVLVPMYLGCDSRRPATSAGGKSAGVVADAEVQALAALESQQNADHVRTVLQQLDGLDSASSRPVLSASDQAALAAFLRLTPSEATEAGQTAFSQADAAYVEECLLVRAGVRALRLDGLAPLEQARLAFDWACRMVYVDDRVSWPANPWTTLQTGSGLALSRAYVILAVWQQLGLDGCLVGPPALKDTASYTPPRDPRGGPPTYAPVRACGVRIDKDVFLFDPASGGAVPTPDRKGVLELSQARTLPGGVAGIGPSDEARTWQPFLAPPLPGIARRMVWLQQYNPGSTGVKLYVDVSAMRARFDDSSGLKCEAWNPIGDGSSAVRVLTTYATEPASSQSTRARRDIHKGMMVPLDLMPRTNLVGITLDQMRLAFLQPFIDLRYTAGSPRDLQLRGQYQQAAATLEDTKRLIDNARLRVENDSGIGKDFAAWADEFERLSSALIRAERSDPGAVPAARAAMAQFRSQPKNLDVERAYIFGHAAGPLGADVNFMMAACEHERAERQARTDPAEAAARWRNAEEWWGRFLDASAQARSPFPAREPHARALRDRCRQFTVKK